MPVQKFGHYGICLGYPSYYYQLEKTEKARAIAEVLIGIFQQKIAYYSSFDESYLELIFDDIERNLNMYRSVVSDMENYEQDTDYLEKAAADFVSHIKLFQHLIE
jgi:hypothetical protein